MKILGKFAIIILLLFPLLQVCPAEKTDIKTMEGMTEQIDVMSNIEARGYVDIYFKLAYAYLEAGRKDEAIQALIKGLRVNAWDYDNQLTLAELEIEKGLIGQAVDRLGFILENCSDTQIIRLAQELLELPDVRDYRATMPERPNLPGYKLYIACFRGTDPIIIQAVASRISQEFGIAVEILGCPLIPDSTGMRNKSFQRWVFDFKLFFSSSNDSQYSRKIDEFRKFFQDQYNVQILIKQITEVYSDKLSQPKVLGVLGITDKDIYEADFNYLFGSAKVGAGVMSYARFLDKDISRDTVLKRAVMQAFSSTGFILGIERCTTADCARAYPHSLEEHDRKNDKLCPVCLENLRKNYENRKKGISENGMFKL